VSSGKDLARRSPSIKRKRVVRKLGEARKSKGYGGYAANVRCVPGIMTNAVIGNRARVTRTALGGGKTVRGSKSG